MPSQSLAPLLRALPRALPRPVLSLVPSAAARGFSVATAGSCEEKELKYIAKTYTQSGVRSKPGLSISHGEGCYLYDTQGRRYLDFNAGIAVSILGHADPDWAAAIAEQAKKLGHLSNLYFSQPYLGLAERLIENSSFDKAFFCNSGTEANEAALKFSRLWANHAERSAHGPVEFACYKPGVTCHTRGGVCSCWPRYKKTRYIAFKGGFHGRSMGSLSLTHKPAIREPFGPMVADVTFLPYNDLEAVKREIGDDVCAIFVEPIQGEGGVNPAKPEFLKGLRKLCDDHGALLVCDEVQSGLGRTGYLWAHEAYDVKPDIMTLAKPLAGGLPIGAVLMTDKVASSIHVGSHGTTFGGSPIPCRAGEVVMDKLLDPKFLEGVRKTGKYMFQRLQELQKKFPDRIKEVRAPEGKVGLFCGVEFNEAVSPIQEAASDEGVLFISAGEKILRLAPPLTVTKEDVELAVATLEKVLTKRH